MRRIHHLILGALALLILLIAALAFVFYDPLSSGRKWLKPSELITAAPGEAAVTSPLEPPIKRTDPAWLSALALRYQPELIVSAYDRFWPVSLSSMLSATYKRRTACLYHDEVCRLRSPTVLDLSHGGSRTDYLRFPTPVDNVRDTFDTLAEHLGATLQAVLAYPRQLSGVDPFRSAEVYFYFLRRAPDAAYRGLPHGLISLEYWFLYPLNYFPLLRIPLAGLRSPIGTTIGNTDYHQGDLEHVVVLLDPETLQPRYLWMARHANEGAGYRWHSSSVQWQGDHPVIYAALGSHASYARCGIQRRSRTYFFINDYVVCTPHATDGFLPGTTPLIDLAHVPWACWPGHLGESGPELRTGQVGLAPFETPGPPSPLQQGENFPGTCHAAPGTPPPPPQL